MMQMNKRMTTIQVATGHGEDSIILEGIVRKLENGTLFLSWTGGGTYEPSQKNRTMYSRSFDGGKTWEPERILFQHPKKGIFTPALFVDGNRLFAFPGSYYDDTNFAQDMQSYWSVSEDGGGRFSVPCSFPGCINNIHIKCTKKIGNRWLFACSWIELDGNGWAPPGGDKASIVAGNENVEWNGTIWEWNGQNHTEYCGVLMSEDEGKSWRICGRIGHTGRRFVEPMLEELSDGTLVMLLRTDEPWLWISRSTDGGEHWSESERTEIPSAVTKVCLLRGNDGAIYLLHNPNPKGRNPLELWISRDDMNTWQEKHTLLSGEDEKECFCYPDGFLDEERKMLCFAWENRKAVYYSEFSLEE